MLLLRSFLAIALFGVIAASFEDRLSTPTPFVGFTREAPAELPEELTEDSQEVALKEAEALAATDAEEEEPESDGMDVSQWIVRRSQRAIDGGSRRRSQCSSVAYHTGSEVGHVATCQFDWVVNRESRRIPERIIEQVCRGCDHSRPCGPSHRCVQLKMRFEVFYRDTREFAQQELRAGCVCLPHDVGSTANPLLIPV